MAPRPPLALLYLSSCVAALLVACSVEQDRLGGTDAAPTCDGSCPDSSPESRPQASMVYVGGRGGPVVEEQWACEPLQAELGARAPLALRVDARGELVAVSIVVPGDPCRCDEETTARALVVVAAGGLFVDPPQRTLLWQRVGTLDLAAVRGALRGVGSFRALRGDPGRTQGLSIAVAAAVHSLRSSGATRLVGVERLGTGESLGLGFESLTLSPDRRRVLLSVNFESRSEEFKAVLADGRAYYLRPAFLRDVSPSGAGGSASERVVIELPVRNPTTVRIDGVAPSIADWIARGGSLPRPARDAAQEAYYRTIGGAFYNIMIAGEPLLAGAALNNVPCQEALNAAIYGQAGGARLGEFRSSSDLANRSLDLLAMAPSWLETPAVVARCVGVPERVARWLDVVGSLRDLFATAAAVVDIFPVFSEVALGPLYDQFDVNLCAACPERPVPECAESGGVLVCGAAAVRCARHPSTGRACSTGTGACASSGTYVCLGASASPVCDARPGAPRAESCTGGGDEDCDGAADCSDPDCSSDRACLRCPPDRCSALAAGTAAVCVGSTAVTCRSAGGCLAESGATDCLTRFPQMTGRCRFGSCEPVPGSCRAGWGDCDGVAANGCERSLTADPSNCGRCGTVCPGTSRCSAGACVTTCPSGTTPCGARCADLRTEPLNCGACGRACLAGANAVATCTAGACGAACAAGYGNCDGSASSGCETDLRSSVAHCGACGNACRSPAGGSAACRSTVCSNGCPSGQSDCNGVCRPTGGRCTAGVGACLRSGVVVCAGTATACSASATPPAAFEACDNGADDDCNGSTDDRALCGLPCGAPSLVAPAGDPGRGEGPVEVRRGDRVCFSFRRSSCTNQVHYLKARECTGSNCVTPVGTPVIDRPITGDTPSMTRECVTIDSRFAVGSMYRWVVDVRPSRVEDPRYAPQYRVLRVAP